jgi:hypothetical protein
MITKKFKEKYLFSSLVIAEVGIKLHILTYGWRDFPADQKRDH